MYNINFKNMKLRNLLTPLFFVCNIITLMGQTSDEIALQKFKDALLFINNGEMARGRLFIKEAIDIDSKDMRFPYELAYSYYVEEDFSTTIRILENWIDKGSANHAQFYQLLGNCYALQGNCEEAFAAFAAGLAKFPDSGPLYLEKGNMERNRGHLAKALSNYEKGIEVEPQFSLNYFRAAEMCMAKGKHAKALVYAETYINLDTESSRAATASRILYEIYSKQLKNDADTNFFGSKGHYYGGKISFEQLCTVDLKEAIKKYNQLDLASLDAIRTTFIKKYFEKGHNVTHPEPFFDYQKKILDAGHIQAYNYWILAPNDIEAFNKWKSDHKQQWSDFVGWIGFDPL